MNEQKNASVGNSFKIHLDEDYADEIEYPGASGSKRKKNILTVLLEKMGIGGFSKTEVALIISGIFLIFLIIMFILFFPGKTEKEETLKISQLTSRLTAVEEKLGRLSLMEQQLAIIAEQTAAKGKDMEIFLERYDRQETAIVLQLEQLKQAVEELEKQKTAAKSQAPAKTVHTPKTHSVTQHKQKVPSTSKSRIHTVSKGDTVYSISRHYGVSVKALQELNQLSAELVIFPGQKLKIPQH
jgi:LysM repeat protein